jgi:hypothetical protein
MTFPLQSPGSNDTQAVWTSDNTLAHQPPAPLLLHEAFDHGGESIGPIFAPNSRQWEGPAPAGLPQWQKWSFTPGALVDSWIDIERRQAVAQIANLSHAATFDFAGMIVPFPTPPSFPFRCIIYSKLAMNRSVQEVAALVENLGGLFVSFNPNAASDGEIIAVGAAQVAGGTYGGMCAHYSDTKTLVAPATLCTGAGPYVRLRVLCQDPATTIVQGDFSYDGGRWWSAANVFNAIFAGPPTFVGIGGSSKSDGVGLDQGMNITADYIRAYDGTVLPAGSLATNGATLLI